jgi:hypothetical protein
LVTRWALAIAAGLATFCACWWGLEAGAGWQLGDALGLAAVPFTVVFGVTSYWASQRRDADGSEESAAQPSVAVTNVIQVVDHPTAPVFAGDYRGARISVGLSRKAMIVAVAATLAVDTAAILIWAALSARPAPGSGSGIAPGQEAPSSVNTEGRIIPSYEEFATAPYQDIDVNIANNGFIAQAFIAHTPTIEAVTFIASRQFYQGATFTENAIGRVRMELIKINPQGDFAGDVPIALLDSGDAPSASGVLLNAGPNHENTTVKLEPAHVSPGDLYAFKVTNLCGGRMSFSLRPYGLPGRPAYLYGYESPYGLLWYVQKRTERAVSGSVCNVYDSC